MEREEGEVGEVRGGEEGLVERGEESGEECAAGALAAAANEVLRSAHGLLPSGRLSGVVGRMSLVDCDGELLTSLVVDSLPSVSGDELDESDEAGVEREGNTGVDMLFTMELTDSASLTVG